MTSKKLFQLSGAAFVGLVLVSILAFGGSTPGTDASGEELASYYGDHTISQGVTAFLLAAAAPFLVLFAVGLATAIGSHDSGGLSPWGYVLLAGTILVAGAVLVTAFVHFALANAADEELSSTALEALNALDGNTWMAFNPAFGVMMLGAAGVLLSAGVLRWLGWSALVLGVAAFAPFADFFALLGTLVWIVVASIVLAREKTGPAHVAAPGAA